MSSGAERRLSGSASSISTDWEAGPVDYKLEVVIIPVTDVDLAKDFYEHKAGFHVDVDHRQGEDFRIVQLTPPGSACSITLMRNPESAGRVQGLHLVVSDIDAARADLTSRGVEASEPFHFGPGGQTPGHHPERESYGTFMSFADPDGNGFLVQEVRPEASGK
jgi:catechol 2,3-dioxygenase-like lactoylglutathione lyase family enzyme